MNGIVNTSVKRNKTAKHLRVSCIDNSISIQSCNVSLPQDNSIIRSSRKRVCGTGIKNSKCPYSTPEDFMAVKQTGNSLQEEKVLGGYLRNWNGGT